MSPPSVRWVPAARTEAVGSARLRCYRPAAALAGAHWDSRVAGRYLPPRSDIVVFQKAYSGKHLELARRLRRRGKAVIFDLCDNHFYNPAGDAVLAERARRLTEMIGLADLVTVSTSEIVALVEHPAVCVVDDALDVAAPVRAASPATGRHVVWFGNAGSEKEGFGMGDLHSILPELESLGRRVDLHLSVVSNSSEAFGRLIEQTTLETSYDDWTPESARRTLAAADVAILPVTLNPFTRCKSPNRVVTALQHGVAVVAGHVPSYKEFTPHIRFGDWAENVAAYLTDGSLRSRDVTDGQRYIAHRFPPGHLESQWSVALLAALGRR